MHDNSEQQIDDLKQRIKGLEQRLSDIDMQHRAASPAIAKAKSGQDLNEKDCADAENETRSKFLSRMNHELRSPLNSIIGYAQLLELKNRQSNTPQNKYVNEILKASHHLLQLITDLLDLSKIEVNMIELSMVNVDVKRTIDDCLATIQPLADERKLHVSCEFVQCANAWIQADTIRLKQVLLNLLSNAVKYNEQAGTVHITCEKTWGNRLRISVTDSGQGIRQDELESLFNPFNQLSSESYTHEGKDIGLCLSRQLIELMQGRIGAESSYGKGSTFWIELGIAKDHTEELPHSAIFEQGYGASSSSCLLYIEDSPTHMRLVEDILKTMPDIRFIGANTAMLGLELARTHKPDIILLDISLPGMNGFEFYEHLQKQKASCHIPVIALSASALSDEIEKGLRLGFHRYLTKPINITEFTRTVNEVLRECKSG